MHALATDASVKALKIACCRVSMRTILIAIGTCSASALWVIVCGSADDIKRTLACARHEMRTLAPLLLASAVVEMEQCRPACAPVLGVLHACEPVMVGFKNKKKRVRKLASGMNPHWPRRR
jgi:hypothetical protein